MEKTARRLTVAVPTYRRPRLLTRVLAEIARQSRMPDRLIVVDGEGGAPASYAALEESGWAERAETLLIPSTRANMPFQRWLARRAAEDSDALIFFDDDVLLPGRETTAKLCRALDGAPAATCAVNLPVRANARRPAWAGLAEALRGSPDGRLTPGGVRRSAAEDGSEEPAVEWLRGPAMAFRCEALRPECFPYDLFALADIGAGMGEELALARMLAGRIAFVRDLVVEHPDTEPSQVLPARLERQGFAIAYSRRLLNDLCRGGRPTLGDRVGLAWSWGGGVVAALGNGFSHRRMAFARGYLRGVLHGVGRPPRHSRLTPEIDWERDARRSLGAACRIGGPAQGREAAWRAASA
jgi:GT2 family glycosyltransferase